MAKKIFSFIFWILIIALAAIWIIDFMHVQNEEKPQFCLKSVTHTFDDGEVNECVGLGYKIYYYNRSSMSEGYQFGPFFVKMKEPTKVQVNS